MSRTRLCCSATKRCGTTLIEVLVYSALLVLVMAAMYFVLTFSLNRTSVADTTANLQQQCLTAATRMERDLAEGDIGSVTVGASPSGVVFESPRDAQDALLYDAGTGLLQWQSYVCYYLGSTSVNGVPVPCLLRKVEAISPTSASQPVPVSMTTSYFQGNAALNPKTAGFYVTGLDVLATANPLQITLTAAKMERDQNNQVQLQSHVYMRN